MANRKEDEKNERIIRNLLKLPDNRRCINCNSLGPQYVCTNFWTFICTACSGIHREFTHRVKSISVAKFTSMEVGSLQGGGNATAKEIYLKEWDPQRNSIPDGSNVEKLRNFIKHVYVDRRYTGERRFEKPPRGQMGETEDSNENRKTDTCLGASRSPPYEEVYERRFSDRPSPGGRSPGGRSPGYDQRSPARAEVINDWRREDRFANGRRSDVSQTSDGGSNFDSKSPDRPSAVESSSPPLVRPVRDILGENVSTLRVIEPPETNGGRSTDGSLRAQRTASSSSVASSNGNQVELKTETSLIDFDAVPEQPVAAGAPQSIQIAAIPPINQPTMSDSDNWANFDALPEVKSSSTLPVTNPLGSMLFELAAPATFPGHSLSPGASGSITHLATPTSVFAPADAAVGIPAATSTGSTSMLLVGGSAVLSNTSGGQLPDMQPQQSSLFAMTGAQPVPQLSAPVAGGPAGDQPQNALAAPTVIVFPGVEAAQMSQSVTKPVVQEPTSGVAPQASTIEKLTGRKELPEDLFTTNYSSEPGVFPGWHTGPQEGYGFSMQYNMMMPTSTLPQPPNSTNPFDVVNEPSSLQTLTFPSMASIQGALPSMAAAGGFSHMSNLDNPTSHPLSLHQHAASYQSVIPPSSYTGQQLAGSMTQRSQVPGPFGFGGSAFGGLGSDQHLGALYSAPATQNASSGGNPFG